MRWCDMRQWRMVALSFSMLLAGPALADDADLGGCHVALVSVDAANVPTFRADCRWDVAPAWVRAVLSDPVRFAASSSSLKESLVLADGRIVNVQRAGWPLDDRQSTLEVRDEPQPDGGLVRSYRLAPQQAALASGRVQVGVDEGSWRVSAAPRGGTRIELVMRYEPGGNLPAGVVQSMSPPRIARGLDELRLAAEELARAPSADADVAAGPPGGG